jgi:hypothetical protein
MASQPRRLLFSYCHKTLETKVLFYKYLLHHFVNLLLVSDVWMDFCKITLVWKHFQVFHSLDDISGEELYIYYYYAFSELI